MPSLPVQSSFEYHPLRKLKKGTSARPSRLWLRECIPKLIGHLEYHRISISVFARDYTRCILLQYINTPNQHQRSYLKYEKVGHVKVLWNLRRCWRSADEVAPNADATLMIEVCGGCSACACKRSCELAGDDGMMNHDGVMIMNMLMTWWWNDYDPVTRWRCWWWHDDDLMLV